MPTASVRFSRSLKKDSTNIKKRTGEEVCCSEGEEVSEAIDIDWAEYMVCARKMGMSEDEFWNSDPVFFNECLEVFTELEKRKGGALIG